MEYMETFSATSDQPIEPELIKRIAFALAEQNIELNFLDVDVYCLLKFRELFMEQGISQMVTFLDNRVTEAVLPRTKNKSLLTKVLAEKLRSLAPKRNLMIIDRYIFSPSIRNEQEYLDTLVDIIGPVINNIGSLKFITDCKPKNYDSALHQKVEQLIKNLNSKINLIVKWSDYFHDRFWVADEDRGLFVGTSLSGIGIRYSLVDNLRKEDTEAIVEELRRLQLV